MYASFHNATFEDIALNQERDALSICPRHPWTRRPITPQNAPTQCFTLLQLLGPEQDKTFLWNSPISERSSIIIFSLGKHSAMIKRTHSYRAY